VVGAVAADVGRWPCPCFAASVVGGFVAVVGRYVCSVGSVVRSSVQRDEVLLGRIRAY
jgi:hypothetical protein